MTRGHVGGSAGVGGMWWIEGVSEMCRLGCGRRRRCGGDGVCHVDAGRIELIHGGRARTRQL